MENLKESFDLPDSYCSMTPHQKGALLQRLKFPLRFHGLDHESLTDLFSYLEKYCAGRESKEQEQPFSKPHH